MEIGELAKRTGVTASAIRYYETEKLLPHPTRSSGRRVYGPDAIARVRLIHNARSLGFTIHELKLLATGIGKRPPGSWRKFIEKKIEDFDRQSSRLSKMRSILIGALKCECLEIDECRKAFEI